MWRVLTSTEADFFKRCGLDIVKYEIRKFILFGDAQRKAHPLLVCMVTAGPSLCVNA